MGIYMKYGCSHVKCASLVLLLAAAIGLQACDAGDGAESTDITTTTTTATVQPDDIYASLPTGSYDGEQFNVLNNISNFAYTSLDFETQTGDVLDDAVYDRTHRVEELLDVDIVVTELGWDEALDAIRNQILSGDTGYDICFDELSTIALAYQSGMFMDINEIEEIDLDKPWWNKSANDSIRIGDSSYYIFGDIHLMLYECYAPVVYNRTLADELSLEDLYDTVAAGGWTIDKLYECMVAAAADINGDTKIDADDRFGLSIYPWNTMCFFTGCGTSLVTIDSGGIPRFDGISERFAAVYDKLAGKILSDRTLKFDLNTSGFEKLSGDGATTKFAEGGALFLIEPIGSIKRLRDVDFALGILPMPKYDAEQESYSSYILHSAAPLVVPSTNTRPQMTGVIVENLCAEAYRAVRPVYFDKTLDFKYAKDERSIEMLDLLFANGSFDLSVVYGWAGLSSRIIDLMASGNDKLMSETASLEDRFIDELSASVEAYK